MVDFGKLNEDMKRREKLKKFVGMLGSDHEGEQLNALRFIKRMAAEEKKSITELLLVEGRVEYIEKVVYRDAPVSPGAYRRNCDGSAGNSRRYRYTAEDFDPDREEPTFNRTRELLDDVKEAGENGINILDVEDLDFCRSVPYEYSWDHELSSRQVHYARAILRKFRRRTTESPI